MQPHNLGNFIDAYGEQEGYEQCRLLLNVDAVMQQEGSVILNHAYPTASSLRLSLFLAPTEDFRAPSTNITVILMNALNLVK